MAKPLKRIVHNKNIFQEKKPTENVEREKKRFAVANKYFMYIVWVFFESFIKSSVFLLQYLHELIVILFIIVVVILCLHRFILQKETIPIFTA